MFLVEFYTSLPNLVLMGLLYHIASIGTIGSKFTFSMKNFFVSQDTSTKLTYCVFGTVLYILIKFDSNGTTISYSFHRNDRFKINI